jgi:hypothetical protein
MGLSKVGKSTVNYTKFEDILDSIPDSGRSATSGIEMKIFHREDDGSLRQCSVSEIPKEERAKIAIDALVTIVKQLNEFVNGRDPRKSSRH